jgi:hypothetical protein
MNVEIGAESALFPEKECINGIFVAVHVHTWIHWREETTGEAGFAPPELFLRSVNRGILWIFYMYFIQHCFICRPLDSTVSEDAGIEPRTVATSALAVHCNAAEGYYSLIVPCMEMEPRTSFIQSHINSVESASSDPENVWQRDSLLCRMKVLWL